MILANEWPIIIAASVTSFYSAGYILQEFAYGAESKRRGVGS
jgi:hypothetical protein